MQTLDDINIYIGILISIFSIIGIILGYISRGRDNNIKLGKNSAKFQQLIDEIESLKIKVEELDKKDNNLITLDFKVNNLEKNFERLEKDLKEFRNQNSKDFKNILEIMRNVSNDISTLGGRLISIEKKLY